MDKKQKIEIINGLETDTKIKRNTIIQHFKRYGLSFDKERDIKFYVERKKTDLKFKIFKNGQ